MIDWNHIAELLTFKWHKDGKLPVWKDGIEYNYIWTGLIYNSPNNSRPPKSLCFAYTEIWFNEENKPKIHAYPVQHGAIDKNTALAEVWNELKEDERISIMAETLGQKAY